MNNEYTITHCRMNPVNKFYPALKYETHNNIWISQGACVENTILRCKISLPFTFKQSDNQEYSLGFKDWKAWILVRCNIVCHCGLVGSPPAWDGTGCEFDSWQCQIYIPCSLSLWLLGSLRSSLVHMAWHKNCVKKTEKLCIQE